MKNFFVFLSILSIYSCNKKPIEPITPSQYESGVFSLNEGLFEQNNASISFYDGVVSYKQIFRSENGRGLGDTANDFEAYNLNGKEYLIVTVDISSQVEIIDRETMKSVAQIPFFNGSEPRSPRKVVVDGPRAFVCNFDGTVGVIDLFNNSLVEIITVGSNPDAMVLLDDELFVSNSGGLLYPIYDSTVSVINTATYEVVSSFTTRMNPSEMITDGYGDIYLISRGNYADIPTALLRIDAANRTVVSITERPISSMTQVGDWLYYFDQDLQGVYRLNMMTELDDPTQIIDLSEFETFFGLHYDSASSLFYAVDANGYVNSSTIHVYNLSGEGIDTFQGGLNTTDLVFENE